MKSIYLACLSVCVLSQVLAVPIGQCLNGESWSDGCSAYCSCNGLTGEIACVPMCPLVKPKVGCEFVENPDKDEENSLNCCPVEKCLAVCEENGIIIPEGILMTFEDKYCGCNEGQKICFPKH